MTKFASPTKDSTFKLVFGDDNHKNLTMNFLNNFLDRKQGNLIEDIVFMKEELTPRQLRERKSILDIRCKDESGAEFIIEMQSDRENFFLDRGLYYAACLLSRQLDKSDLFTDLKPVILIGILDYNLLSTQDEYISHHLMTNPSTGKQSTNLIELHLVELKKFNKTEEELFTQIDKWIYFLKNAQLLFNVPASCQNSPEITQAFHLMEQSNWTKEQIARYDSDLLNYKKKLTDDYLLIEEGIQKGEYKKAIETAQKMLQESLAVKMINKITGLSIDEINKIQDQMKKLS